MDGHRQTGQVFQDCVVTKCRAKDPFAGGHTLTAHLFYVGVWSTILRIIMYTLL